MNTQAVLDYLQQLQAKIVEAIELVDGKHFLQDSWQRPEGGGGNSCLLEEGLVFERAGVGFSHVLGHKLPPSASAAHPEAAGRPWEAMGVSLVFHPRNPYIPTVHMNVRFFVAKAQASHEEDIWWFGGGMDLTVLAGLMQRRLNGELDLEDLAKVAHLSKFHFIRRFRQLTGNTPIQYFIHLKMQHACRLLDSSEDPIKRIAAAVGYEDPYYFSRIFKRVIGVSPQHYRESRLA